MKQKLTTHYCLDKDCGYVERSHKVRDGLRCPRCGGPTAIDTVRRGSDDAPLGSKT